MPWGASEKQVKQWIAKFDVHARGCSYQPFFQVRDVPSKGRSAMVKGQKTGRTHHFPSDLEYQYFILAEFAPSVFDILEQYPLLPREETISIAKELGIKHPCYPGSNTPIVMTTDNVLCTGSADSEELQPLSIKYASALRSAGSEDKEYVRTIEKLQIEERYWIRRGPWFLCTDALLPLNRVLNLDALRTAVVAEESDWLNPRLPEFVVTFREFWSDRKHLKDIFFETAIELRVTPADIAVLFGRAVWLRLLPIDLDSSVIHHEFPVARLFLISCPRTLSRTVDFFHSNR
jgi:hypothetical protein